jgi:hypothetical protein
MVAHFRLEDHGRVAVGVSPIPAGVTGEGALLEQAIQIDLDRRVRHPAPALPAVQAGLVNGTVGGGRLVPEDRAKLQVGLRERG